MTATALKDPSQPPLPSYAVRGIHLPDLNEKGQWIVDRLRGRFPHSSEGELVNWLRSIALAGNNEFMFLRTEHAFALAQMFRESLSPRPVVVEQFVLVEDAADETTSYTDEGAFLYSVMAQWARGLNAYELRLRNTSDVPRDDIKARLGKLYARDQIFHKLD